MEASPASSPDWPPVQRITEPQAVRVLIQPLERRILAPFLGQGCTLVHAAPLLGLTVQALWRRVKRLETLGLLRLERLHLRAGRPQKVYRTCADAFFVPFGATPYATFEEVLGAMQAPWQRRFERGYALASARSVQHPEHWGTWIARAGEALDVRFAADPALPCPDPPTHSSTWTSWSVLTLEARVAAELRDDLERLWERYQARQAPEGKPHLLRLGLTPDEA